MNGDVVGRVMWGMFLPLALALSLSAAQPRLRLEPASEGRLRITATQLDTNAVIVEGNSSLTESNGWSQATVGVGGLIRPSGSAQYFRLRVVPSTPAALGAAPMLLFEEAPRTLRGGEQALFRVEAPRSVLRGVTWFVDGIEGGSVESGRITAEGLYTAPTLRETRVVDIRARAVLSAGLIVEANSPVTLVAAPALGEPQDIRAVEGGEAWSADGELKLVVPPGALMGDTRFVLQNRVFEASLHDTEEFTTLALATLEPDKSQFLQPVSLELPLNQWVTPGTRLPLFVSEPSGWRQEGTAVVLPGGWQARAFVQHFSTWAIRRPVPALPTTPLPPGITSVAPSVMREGELRAVLLRGSELASVRRVTVHEMDGSPSTFMAVRSFAYTQAAPNEMGVLLKSLPNPGHAAGSTRSYRLRLHAGTLRFVDVTLAVQGLAELDVAPGGELTIPAFPGTNRAVFSRIRIPASAVVRSRARVLAWQATDEIALSGQILSAGPDGAEGAEGRPGVMSEPRRSETGSGDGARGDASGVFESAGKPGTPALTVNLNEYLPGTLNRIYGQPGVSGFNPALLGQSPLATLPAVSEGMYALYESALLGVLDSRDAFDFNIWSELSLDLTELHPEGRKGQQGIPGGFRRRSQWHGFHVGQRVIEPGGGGGGGGATYRPSTQIPTLRIGLSGGSGGGGGGAVSLAAGGEFVFSREARVDTSGGAGGHGARASSSFSNPEAVGFGGGGGPGGAGTIHLLAGERMLDNTGGQSILHRAGAWGRGGFLMTVGTHFQANPRSWLEPVPEPSAPSLAEVAGPDFSSGRRGISTSIRTGRAVEAFALNPDFQDVTVRVVNALGSVTNRVAGVSSDCRGVRLLLAPGTNSLEIVALGDHAVLNREIVVLNTPDTDGDGLEDAEEAELGFNPASADTDGDGISDAAEWLAGGRSAPGDSDGDGIPDLVETNFGSNPFDPRSTPWTVGIGTGTRRGMILATPFLSQVIRPTLGCEFARVRGGVVAGPGSLRLIRPAVGCGSDVSFGPAVARPIPAQVGRP